MSAEDLIKEGERILSLSFKKQSLNSIPSMGIITYDDVLPEKAYDDLNNWAMSVIDWQISLNNDTLNTYLQPLLDRGLQNGEEISIPRIKKIIELLKSQN